MNLSDLERAKSTYTGKASDVVRQFAFAGIAIIWLLRLDKAAQPIPAELQPILALFGLALALDLLHYTVSSVIWTIYYRVKLRENLADGTEFAEPSWITWPGYLLFGGKIAAALTAWTCLAEYLGTSWGLFQNL